MRIWKKGGVAWRGRRKAACVVQADRSELSINIRYVQALLVDVDGGTKALPGLGRCVGK